MGHGLKYCAAGRRIHNILPHFVSTMMVFLAGQIQSAFAHEIKEVANIKTEAVITFVMRLQVNMFIVNVVTVII